MKISFQRPGQPAKNYIAVVVSHIIPDTVHYLRAIDTIFPIQTIVPKPNSIDEKTYTIVRKDFKISHVCREDMAQDTENEVIRILENTNEKILLFDIGGYFAHIHETWPVTILERIALIIEDTENGYQKYEHVIGDSERKKQNYPFKVVSVARSPLKENEDFLVGQSVFFFGRCPDERRREIDPIPEMRNFRLWKNRSVDRLPISCREE